MRSATDAAAEPAGAGRRGAPRGAWTLLGVVVGLAGLATSYLTAALMSIRESPVVAVAELVIRLTPGAVVEWAIDVFGRYDKLALTVGMGVVLLSLFGWFGRLATARLAVSMSGWAVLAVVGGVAVALVPGPTPVWDQTPTVVGLVTWLATQNLLTERLRRFDVAAEESAAAGGGGPGAAEDDVRVARRGFVVGVGVVAAVAGLAGLVGRVAGGGRRRVEQARRLLRLDGVTTPVTPSGVRVDTFGVTPWVTPSEDFYLIDTAVIKPTIEPTDWTLRIHGRVEREVVVTYDDLVGRELTEGWITLNCVSNPVGGNLIGNAWWSGVRVADLLAEAGADPDADAVLQTSEDGWTCGTPLAALTDGRDAMLALAMNGEPLPIEHGFPVRMVVPGLYGYVSACKWVVDLEVTSFDKISAFWTDKGWGEMGPVKMSSRVDVPRSGDSLPGGDVTCAGIAWSQHTGIEAVEVSLDGGAWLPAELASVPNDDTWVQWRAVLTDVADGDHLVRVRATDKEGLVQTGVERDVLPDGATGWHSTDFSTST